MILVTEFMDEAAVATLSAAHPTTYAPHLADNQSEILALMSGVRMRFVLWNHDQISRNAVKGSVRRHPGSASNSAVGD